MLDSLRFSGKNSCQNPRAGLAGFHDMINGFMDRFPVYFLFLGRVMDMGIPHYYRAFHIIIRRY